MISFEFVVCFFLIGELKSKTFAGDFKGLNGFLFELSFEILFGVVVLVLFFMVNSFSNFERRTLEKKLRF